MTKQVNSKQICCGSENVCVWGGGGGGGGRNGPYIYLHVSVSASRAKNYRPNYPTDADEREKGVLFDKQSDLGLQCLLKKRCPNI